MTNQWKLYLLPMSLFLLVIEGTTQISHQGELVFVIFRFYLILIELTFELFSYLATGSPGLGNE